MSFPRYSGESGRLGDVRGQKSEVRSQKSEIWYLPSAVWLLYVFYWQISANWRFSVGLLIICYTVLDEIMECIFWWFPSKRPHWEAVIILIIISFELSSEIFKREETMRGSWWKIISPRQFGIENYAFFGRLDVQLRGRTGKRLLDFRHQKSEGRGKKSEICGLTSEVLSMKFPWLLDGLLHGCDKNRLFYHRRARHVIK